MKPGKIITTIIMKTFFIVQVPLKQSCLLAIVPLMCSNLQHNLCHYCWHATPALWHNQWCGKLHLHSLSVQGPASEQNQQRCLGVGWGGGFKKIRKNQKKIENKRHFFCFCLSDALPGIFFPAETQLISGDCSE